MSGSHHSKVKWSVPTCWMITKRDRPRLTTVLKVLGGQTFVNVTGKKKVVESAMSHWAFRQSEDWEYEQACSHVPLGSSDALKSLWSSWSEPWLEDHRLLGSALIWLEAAHALNTLLSPHLSLGTEYGGGNQENARVEGWPLASSFPNLPWKCWILKWGKTPKRSEGHS